MKFTAQNWKLNIMAHNTPACTDLILGSSILLTPPSLTLILRQRFESVCGVVLFTFFACTHWVAKPKHMSPTLFTSAVEISNAFIIYNINHNKTGKCKILLTALLKISHKFTHLYITPLCCLLDIQGNVVVWLSYFQHCVEAHLQGADVLPGLLSEWDVWLPPLGDMLMCLWLFAYIHVWML